MSKFEKQFQRALELSAQPESSFLELSQHLAALHASDPALFGRFVEQSGVGRRKAYYLLELGRRLRGLRLPKGRVNAIGWTKLELISRRLTPENIEEWLTQAEASTTQELKKLVKGGAPSSKSRCVLLYFSPREYQQLERAILSNGGKRKGRGLDGKEAAIMRMVRLVNEGKRGILKKRKLANGKLSSARLGRGHRKTRHQRPA